MEDVQALSPRDFFYDAPLTDLTSGTVAYNYTLSPIASTDYANVVGWNGIGEVSQDGLANLTKLVGDAHGLGIQVRLWISVLGIY